MHRSCLFSKFRTLFHSLFETSCSLRTPEMHLHQPYYYRTFELKRPHVNARTHQGAGFSGSVRPSPNINATSNTFLWTFRAIPAQILAERLQFRYSSQLPIRKILGDTHYKPYESRNNAFNSLPYTLFCNGLLHTVPPRKPFNGLSWQSILVP